MGVSAKLEKTLAEVASSGSDATIRAVITLFKEQHPRDPLAASRLALVLAESGARIAPSDILAVDVASTGGPSSLSTLLTPLFLRAAGVRVPKLGVPGRPAGGIDCLAQVPGYRTVLSSAEVSAVLESCGYAHFLATREVAPLDGRMFRLRQEMDAQAVPSLVTASILAKKVAVGIGRAGLDIRVAPHGNFGSDWTEARKNAQLFVEAAQQLGIAATAVLTDGRYLYQPYLGRAESLQALEALFSGEEISWLGEHCSSCKSMAMACLPENLRGKAHVASRNLLRRHFEANLVAQGASIEGYSEYIEQVGNVTRVEIFAEREGFCEFPLKDLRTLFVENQGPWDDALGVFPDPIGICFAERPGSWVEKGALLATVRIADSLRESVIPRLQRAIAHPSARHISHQIEVIDA
jgi:thymidine phosphorylase